MNPRAWNPEAFWKRIKALMARGVDERLAHELWEAGNVSLVAEVERASDQEVAELNAAYAAR